MEHHENGLIGFDTKTKSVACSVPKFQFHPLYVVVLDLLQPLLPVLGPHDNLWLLKMVPNDFFFS